MLRTVRTTVALTTGALALGVLGVTPSTAADQYQAPASPATVQGATETTVQAKYGRVVSRVDLHIRSRATTNSRALGSFHPGATIALRCKVRGQNVMGNHIWYKLEHRSGWVTARYVKNLNYIPWCR